MSSGGDGVKNYFCYLYFIRYDAGTHFTGMNYPFGENIIFTDNMPALAWTIAKIKTIFPGIVNYGLVLMHSTFIISYFLCTVFIYKILRLFNVKGWWGPASAVFIAYFSPQFFRLFGHFSLSLVCFFPMMIYWLMQYERKRALKYVVYIFLLTTLFSFLHVYYLAFSLVLCASYCFAYLTKKGSLKKKITYIIPVLVAIGASVFIFKLYLKITDPVTDRPIHPLGFLDTYTSLYEILTSDYNFIGFNLFAHILKKAAKGTEGYCYPGLISLIVSAYLLYRILKSVIVGLAKKKKIPIHPIRGYRRWLIVMLIALLFSMGAPFTWGLDFLADYVSIFRQFRSLGRFSWIFYYLISIYTCIFLYRLFCRMHLKGYRKLYFATVVIILAVWFIEWNGYAQDVRQECRNAKANYDNFYSRNTTSWTQWMKEKGTAPQNFQGIIGLSYMHIGSEKTGVQENAGAVMYTGAQIACETGLPMMDVMMSRTSWSQTFANLRMIDGPLTPKPIVNKFNEKAFLIFVTPQIPLTPGEQNLVDHAVFIGKKDDIDLYSLDVKAMVKAETEYRDSIKNVVAGIPQKEGLLDTVAAFTYCNHFDQYSYDKPFAGKGAYPAAAEEGKLLASFPITHPTNDSLFVASAWFLSHKDQPNMVYLVYKQYDSNDSLVAGGDIPSGQSKYALPDWFKGEKVIYIHPKAVKMEWYVQGSSKNFIAIDELLIYPAHSLYFYKTANRGIILNNRPSFLPGEQK